MFIIDGLFLMWLIRKFLRKNDLRVAVVQASPPPAPQPPSDLPVRVPEPRSGPNWDSLAGSPEPEYEARQEAHSDAASEVDLGIQARAFWAAKGWEGALRGECQHPFDPACPRQRELVTA